MTQRTYLDDFFRGRTGMWTYRAGSIRGTWNHPECYLQALTTIPRSCPGLAFSLVLAGLLYGERQVPVTIKRTSMNDTISGVQNCLFDGGIILGSKTELHAQIGTMIDQIYLEVILELHVRLFRGAMEAEFVFKDDNACPHRANIDSVCLQSEDITRMDWPAFSPDLNPLEHVWYMLRR
ncbi:DDE_3 domain-containing protein [Trichonephila clavipes]|nr:DDE_3 domain-containing protein [Trichonephila clavipes]